MAVGVGEVTEDREKKEEREELEKVEERKQPDSKRFIPFAF